MTDHKPAEDAAREWLHNHSAEDGNIYNASPADGSEVKGLQDLLEAGPLHSLTALLTTREAELRAEVERLKARVDGLERDLVSTFAREGCDCAHCEQYSFERREAK